MFTWTTVLTPSLPLTSLSAAPIVLGPVVAFVFLATLASSPIRTTAVAMDPDTDFTLGCFRRMYNYRVVQSDSKGRMCWDNVSVMSCWGRCDTHEISDWRFPYKTAHHHVCQHEIRKPAFHRLRHCQEDVMPGTENYTYLQAITCRCMSCRSSETSCEGVRSRATTKAGVLLAEVLAAEHMADGTNAVTV